MDIPSTLMRHLGHADCGIYAQVVGSGSLIEGEEMAIEETAQATLPLG